MTFNVADPVRVRYEGRWVLGIVADVDEQKGVLVSLKRTAMLKTRKWFPPEKVERAGGVP